MKIQKKKKKKKKKEKGKKRMRFDVNLDQSVLYQPRREEKERTIARARKVNIGLRYKR